MQNDIEKVISVIDYIEAHLSEKIDLEIVAEAVHYSKYYLHRIFTRTVGLTLHDYVQRRQLTEAAKLLVFSDKPIVEIALIAGYESQQAFTSIFKNMYKKTPGQYRDHEAFYPLQLKYALNENPMASDKVVDWKNDIRFAGEEDIPKWLDLVTLVVDGFPCLDEEQYRKRLREYISEKRALILTDGELAIGAMGLKAETGSIDFLGVHPQYRKKGITQAFLKKAFSLLIDGTEISVTTFREGDKADPGYRNIFKKLGFAEAELLIEHGYPTQRFVLQKIDMEDAADG